MTEKKEQWTCLKCQARNDPDFTHCRLCGQEKETADAHGEKKCAHCGNVCTDYFTCPKCGGKEFLQL